MKYLYLSIILVFTISTQSISQLAKLLASDGNEGDKFGISIDMDEDYAVNSAYLDDVNGYGAGSVYIFKREGIDWIEESKLVASDASGLQLFGKSVAIHGNRVLIGSNLDDENGASSGAAYIFKRTGSTWIQEAKLLPDDGAVGNFFGFDVDLEGDYAIIGAWGNSTGGYFRNGAAYIFKYDGNTWNQEAKLTASDGASFDTFGTGVAISGDIAFVGATWDVHNGIQSGSVYVFKRDSLIWSQQAKVLPSDPSTIALYGSPIKANEDELMISAFRDDESGPSSGAVYYYIFDGNSWTEQAKLIAPDASADDQFGRGFSFLEDVCVIGAPGDDDQGSSSGSAYLFRKNSQSWVFDKKLLPDDGAADDFFGLSVAMAGNHAIIGAINDDDQGASSGSAYVFKINLTPEEAIGVLIDQIDDLIALGIIKKGNGNALKSKLDAAIKKIEQGKFNSGINLLNAFIQQVNALLQSGKISEALAQNLIDAANRVISSLNETEDFTGFTPQFQSIDLDNVPQISVYPNPFDQGLNLLITTEQKGNYQLNIFSLTGERMQQAQNITIPSKGFFKHQIDGHNLPDGIYIVQIITPHGDMIHRRVVRSSTNDP